MFRQRKQAPLRQFVQLLVSSRILEQEKHQFYSLNVFKLYILPNYRVTTV
jgi:hypothetical protein